MYKDVAEERAGLKPGLYKTLKLGKLGKLGDRRNVF